MPPVPEIFAISPCASLVVALPNILGLTIENTALATAHNITAKIPILYLPAYLINFFDVPLKSLAFSPGLRFILGIISPPFLLCLPETLLQKAVILQSACMFRRT